MLGAQQKNILLHAGDHAAKRAAERAANAQGQGMIRNAEGRKGFPLCVNWQRHPPLRQIDRAVFFHGCKKVLAACKPRRADAFRVANHLVHTRHRSCFAVLHHADAAAVAVAFVQIVAHPKNRPAKQGKQVGKLQFKIPLQVAVERGEGFIEQNGFRLGREDPCECHALLLSAGELRGVFLLKPLQTEHADLLRQQFLFLRLVLAADAAEDILLHRHVRKERILLEEVSDSPLLGRQVDLLLAVEENAIAEHDAPAVGRHDARDAL